MGNQITRAGGMGLLRVTRWFVVNRLIDTSKEYNAPEGLGDERLSPEPAPGDPDSCHLRTPSPVHHLRTPIILTYMLPVLPNEE